MRKKRDRAPRLGQPAGGSDEQVNYRPKNKLAHAGRAVNRARVLFCGGERW